MTIVSFYQLTQVADSRLLFQWLQNIVSFYQRDQQVVATGRTADFVRGRLGVLSDSF